jgi:hypothetical protein
MTALAIATLCFWPPESFPPLVPQVVWSPTWRSFSSTSSSSISSFSSIATLFTSSPSVSLEINPFALEIPAASIAFETSLVSSEYHML